MEGQRIKRRNVKKGRDGGLAAIECACSDQTGTGKERRRGWPEGDLGGGGNSKKEILSHRHLSHAHQQPPFAPLFYAARLLGLEVKMWRQPKEGPPYGTCCFMCTGNVPCIVHSIIRVHSPVPGQD